MKAPPEPHITAEHVYRCKGDMQRKAVPLTLDQIGRRPAHRWESALALKSAAAQKRTLGAVKPGQIEVPSPRRFSDIAPDMYAFVKIARDCASTR